jgi:uncharacterized membrane protein
LDLCFVLVVVGVVVGLLLVAGCAVELVDLPPQPATAKLLASTARSVSMAASGVLLIGQAPIVDGGLGRSPYQAFLAPIAVA